jgi:hypothetical protein
MDDSSIGEAGTDISKNAIPTRTNIPVPIANGFTPERTALITTCGTSIWGTRLWRREAI